MVQFIAEALEKPADEIVLFSLQKVVADDDSEMSNHVDVKEMNAVVNVGFSIDNLPMKTIFGDFQGPNTELVPSLVDVLFKRPHSGSLLFAQ